MYKFFCILVLFLSVSNLDARRDERDIGPEYRRFAAPLPEPKLTDVPPNCPPDKPPDINGICRDIIQ